MGKKLKMKSQPTDSSCGPTCLKAIYDYYDLPIDLEKIIREVKTLKTGGTLGACLGIHALDHGFDATLYTFNLEIFDPTWFFPKPIDKKQIIQKLRLQKKLKHHAKLQDACDAFIEFLEKGGRIKMRDLSGALLMRYLKRKIPIITGLSSTYLYKCSRIHLNGDEALKDDVLGAPEGHFVVLESYNPESRLVTINDPWHQNPYSQDLKYEVSKDHLLTSFLIGLLTYDANFTIITKKHEHNDLTFGI
ncbi:cysteine peptidase family C39 domain-containing protein [Estrella lausannensis]|uniref:Peptidase C39 domain-containing protein n=1 Tax=Estrella lausannensis TaxID=483423 RepID=A0A0H5DS72_9BACT|nr:cysteine peptidase family C39 domain-containing protein [Estrella lausannensis]CRX39133.1 hypothetical protein ELAC_1808 [Estrella lausannensis]